MTSPTPVPVGLFARRMPAWIGDLLAVVFVLGGALAPYPGSPMQTGNLVGLIAGVVGALAMPLRRRWPIPVLTACIALFGVAVFSGAGAAGRVMSKLHAHDRAQLVIIAYESGLQQPGSA
jgi:hypothetical protein